MTIKELIVTIDGKITSKFCLSEKEKLDSIKLDDYLKEYSIKNKIQLLGLESTSKTFSYNETRWLDELRKNHKKQMLEKVFLKKKTEFLDQIKDKENNINFIQTLLDDDKSLEKYFIEHQKKLENDIRSINSNLKFMEDVLN